VVPVLCDEVERLPRERLRTRWSVVGFAHFSDTPELCCRPTSL
jgi:hypothetical protein